MAYSTMTVSPARPETDPASPQHTAAQASLLRALAATGDDLTRNRDGRISQRQRDLNGAARLPRLAIVVLMGHALLITGLLGGIALLTGQAALWLVLGIVLLLTLVPFVLMKGEATLQPVLRDDVQAGRVEAICGSLVRRPGNGRVYRIIVQGEGFEVSKTVWNVVSEQRDYCVYYLPKSRRVLTMEIV